MSGLQEVRQGDGQRRTPPPEPLLPRPRRQKTTLLQSRQHPPAAQEQRADLQVRQRGQAGGEEGGRQRGVAQFQQAQIPQELPAPQNQLPHQTPEGGRLQLRGRAQRKPHRRRGETQFPEEVSDAGQPHEEAAAGAAAERELRDGGADEGGDEREADEDQPGHRDGGGEAAAQPEAVLHLRRARAERAPGVCVHEDGADKENLTASLKKLHNHPEKDKLVELIYLALQNTNQQLLDSEINTELAGSTLVAVFAYHDKLLVFNVGDSRAILLQQHETNICREEETDPSKFPQLSNVKPKEEHEWTTYPLSIDQKPDRPDEKQRIIKNGGRVFAQTNETGDELGPARVWMKDVMMPGLAMSRSFGDKAGIKAGTNAEPELIEHTMEATDKLIVVASDGIWEYLENEDVMKIVSPFLLKDDLNGAADQLMKRGVETWAKMNYARDDITFILVKLNNPDK